MRYLIPVLLVAIIAAGCVLPPPGASGNPGSAKYQACISQCGPGNAGNGTYCEDGCRVQEAQDTNGTYWCDQLANKPEIPACYGTVAKSAGDRTVCDRLSNVTARNYCISAFGNPSTG